MQYVHTHSLEITHMSGYSNDEQKRYPIQDSKITKKSFNKIALMEHKYLDKWTGTVTCQKMLEALENDNSKRLSADIQSGRCCNGRYWMWVAFPAILWKLLD